MGISLCVAPAAFSDGDGGGGRVLISAKAHTDGLWTQDVTAINAQMMELRVPLRRMPSRVSVKAFRLEYVTTNLRGERVKASGLVRVRSDILQSGRSAPLISYQHATKLLRREAPSSTDFDAESMGGGALFASEGYVWAMPDYLGFGANGDPQAYLHAQGQAVVCADFLMAVDEWAIENGFGIDRDVFLMGYSQGGHSTLALHKLLESPQDNFTRFKVRASFPMAGPYAITGVGLEQALKSTSAQVFVAMAFVGLSHDPSLGIDLKSIFSEAYVQVLDEVFDGKHTYDEVLAALKKSSDQKKATELFKPSFLASLALMGKAHPVLKALRQQDVVDFLPIAPIFLVHAPDDEVVPYEHTRVALDSFKALDKNAKVQVIVLDKGLDHAEASRSAFTEVSRILNEQFR